MSGFVHSIAYKSSEWILQEQSEKDYKIQIPVIKIVMNVKYSIGNIVNNIVITMHGVRWVLDLSGYHFVRSINI